MLTDSPTLELIGRRQLGWPGETRNITCIGRGLPVPSMNWYRGEQYLHDSDTYRITDQRAADSVASTLSVRVRQRSILRAYKTSGSVMAEGPRDALVSRNSTTTKYRYRVALFA